MKILMSHVRLDLKKIAVWLFIIESQLRDYKLDKVWHDEHFVKIQVKGRYVERW